MPNQISPIGQVIAQDNGAPVVPRPSPSAPAEAASVSRAQPAVRAESVAPSADSAALKQAAEQINEFIKSSSRNLEFLVDKGSGRIIVKVLDQETGEVIRQVPAEETLAIARSLDTPQGVIIRSKA